MEIFSFLAVGTQCSNSVCTLCSNFESFSSVCTLCFSSVCLICTQWSNSKAFPSDRMLSNFCSLSSNSKTCNCNLAGFGSSSVCSVCKALSSVDTRSSSKGFSSVGTQWSSSKGFSSFGTQWSSSEGFSSVGIQC